MKTADFLKNNTWEIWGDSYLDVSGEYVRVNSWTANRRLNNTLTYVVHIHSRRRGKYGYQPTSWYGKLCCNGRYYNIPTTHPSCKSIRDALFYADRALTEEIFLEAAQFFLSTKHIHCVLKEEKGGLTPYWSSFGPSQWIEHRFHGGKMLHPMGTYYEVWRGIRYEDRKQIDIIDCSKTKVIYYGYVGSNIDNREDIDHWLPNTQTWSES
jgi:hypothetical protein